MELAKGYRGRRGSVFRIAKEAVMKAGQYAYRDRRTRKRVFRALWIARINAAARECGLTYSVFMNGLKRSAIEVDRKVLADLAVTDMAAFARFAEQAKASLPSSKANLPSGMAGMPSNLASLPADETAAAPK